MELTVTEKQLEILRFIAGYRAEHGVSPTQVELSSWLGVSKTTVHGHVQRLLRKGVLRSNETGIPRSLCLTQAAEEWIDRRRTAGEPA